MRFEPNAECEAFLAELKAAVGNCGKDLDASVVLAVASQFVGMLAALQDQRRWSPDTVMAIIARNIEIGNATAIDVNLGSPEGSA